MLLLSLLIDNSTNIWKKSQMYCVYIYSFVYYEHIAYTLLANIKIPFIKRIGK